MSIEGAIPNAIPNETMVPAETMDRARRIAAAVGKAGAIASIAVEHYPRELRQGERVAYRVIVYVHTLEHGTYGTAIQMGEYRVSMPHCGVTWDPDRSPRRPVRHPRALRQAVMNAVARADWRAMNYASVEAALASAEL